MSSSSSFSFASESDETTPTLCSLVSPAAEAVDGVAAALPSGIFSQSSTSANSVIQHRPTTFPRRFNMSDGGWFA